MVSFNAYHLFLQTGTNQHVLSRLLKKRFIISLIVSVQFKKNLQKQLQQYTIEPSIQQDTFF